ncbi:MAG: hypothetical protein WCF61_14990 [Terriglobales bacterium]
MSKQEIRALAKDIEETRKMVSEYRRRQGDKQKMLTAGGWRVLDLTENDIIMGLADIARTSKSDSAKVRALDILSQIRLMRAKSLEDLQQFRGWTTDELQEFIATGNLPDRIARALAAGRAGKLMAGQASLSEEKKELESESDAG